ncbi:MAG: integrase, partial [Lachnospiraceae bacterium]|nr:integrase [Lachnospiraceae bacterium]
MNENLIPPRDPPLKIEPFFDYNGYQVVRGEFFAHKQEPSVTFYNGRISFNNACVRKMPDITHVEIMVSRTEKKLLVRPGNEDEKDSIRWCNERNNARTISCSIL